MRDMRDSGIDWLGSIPSDWKLRKIKFCFDIVKDIIGYEGPPVLACTNTGIKVKDLTYGSGQLAKDYSNYQWVRPGDFVMNNLDLVGGWIDVSTLEGVTSPDYRVFRAKRPEYDNGYYRYLFQLCYMGRIFRDTSNVVEGMGWGRMQAPVFKNFVVPVPSLETQRAIAMHLENCCAEIDRAINAAEELLVEYLKYKYSIIYSAITRGIGDAKRRESGIEWLGDIAENWGTVEVGRLAKQIKCPNDGMQENNLLSLSYGTVRRRDINSNEGLLPASFETYNIIEDGDIVLRFTDLQNDQKSLRVGRATERGIITSAYVVVRPHNYDSSRYIYYALHSYDLRKGFYGMGAGVRQGLKWQEARYIPIPQPPLEEQVAIANYLDEKCAQIDAAIAAKRSIIDELKAYKKSLVYEYVTGKREVPCQ